MARSTTPGYEVVGAGETDVFTPRVPSSEPPFGSPTSAGNNREPVFARSLDVGVFWFEGCDPSKQKEHFNAFLNKAARDESIIALVLLQVNNANFVGGSDVESLMKFETTCEAENYSKRTQDFLRRLEKFKKPIVAGIMGQCQRGALELALACHYRMAVDDKTTQLCFPEVLMGVNPSAGGTQRLLKLISIERTLDMLLFGGNVHSNEAMSFGLIDEVLHSGTDEDYDFHCLRETAVVTARKLAKGSLLFSREKPFVERAVKEIMCTKLVLDNVILKMARDKILKNSSGNPAPLKIMDVVRTGVLFGTDAGYAAERKAFGELSQSFQSKALIGLFVGSFEAKKAKYGLGAVVTEVAVISAGLLGAAIVNVTIDKGLMTVLLDKNDQGLQRGRGQITDLLEKRAQRKIINMVEKQEILSKLVTSVDYKDIAKSNVVIETVGEDLDLKHKIINQIELVVSPNTVIGVNAFILPIKEIAKASTHPENVIGMNYSTVEKMQLLELIVHDGTSKETLATAANLGLKQGMMIIVVKDSPGFFVARCLGPMIAESFRLFQEGVSAPELDKITKKFDFPFGIAELIDDIGLEFSEHIVQYLGKAYGSRVQGGSSELLTDLIKAGCKGRSHRKGIYVYSDGKKGSKKVNGDAVKILQKHRREGDPECSSTHDIEMRLVSRFVNEAAICLEEGVISGPLDGDIASVFGIGFPPFWGGPFRFVDLHGAQKLVDSMNKFADAYSSEQFIPCQLLKDHAKYGKKFYSC